MGAFSGRHVFITGGSSGIGKQLAGGLLKRGAHVGIAADRADRMQVPPRSLVMGAPAKVRREVTDEEQAGLRRYAESYGRAGTPVPPPIVPPTSGKLGAKAASSFGLDLAGTLLGLAAERMSCGPARQAMHSGAGAIAFAGGVEVIGYAIGGGLAAFGPVPALSPIGGGVAVVPGSALARQGLVEANAQYFRQRVRRGSVRHERADSSLSGQATADRRRHHSDWAFGTPSAGKDTLARILLGCLVPCDAVERVLGSPRVLLSAAAAYN